MQNRFRWRAVAAALLAAVVAVGMLSGCKSDKDQVSEAVASLMESYVVPVPDEDGNVPEDAPWPAADYGDAATMEVLRGYGVDADEWHRHCFARFGYEVGEVVVEGDAATASVTVTNASLASAVEEAGADFDALVEGGEAQEAYRQGGRPALFERLVEFVYDRLDADESPVVTTVTVSCVRDDEGAWVPDVAGDAAFFSALYGGSDVIAGLGAADDAEVEGE